MTSPSTETLLAEVLDRLDQGDPQALEDVCRRHPDRADAVRAQIDKLRQLNLVDPGAAIEPPRRLGGFVLEERVGGGGMGVVYRAREEELDREVALKVIRPDQLHSEAVRARFRRETEAAAKLQHPGIVPVHTVGEEGGIPFFTMEFVRGASLDRVLEELGADEGSRPARLSGADFAAALERCLAAEGGRTEGLSEAAPDLFRGRWEDVCLRLVLRVAEALAHAHQRAIYHRDLKPSNIMVTLDGRVLLVDFGLSRLEGSTRLTMSEAPVGSLMYMPPEVLERREDIDARRGDVYSLGATLFELLTFVPPYRGENAASLLLQIARGERRELRAENPTLSWETDTIVATAMERAPRRRYADAAALACDLENALAHRPITAKRAGPWLRAQRFVQRRPTLSVATGLGALLLVGGPLVFAWQQQRAASSLQELNQELEGALDKAEAERTKAEANFETAFEAIQGLLDRTGREDLKDVPRVQAVRAELLELAEDLYQRLLRRAPEDLRLRRAVAAAGVSRARVSDLLGNREDSIRRMHAALEQFEALVPIADEPNLLRLEMIRANGSLGRTLHLMGRLEESTAAYDAARALAQTVLSDDPAEHEREMAEALLSVFPAEEGIVQLKGDDPSQALATYEKGLAETREQLALHPNDVGIRMVLAKLLNDTGRLVYRWEHNLERAANLLTEAQELHAEISFELPDDREVLVGLLNASLNLAAVRRDLGQTDEALISIELALEIGEGLVQSFPSVPEYRSALADVYITRGILCGDDLELALEYQLAAVAAAEQVTRDVPEEGEYWSSLGLAASNAAWITQQLGRLDEAQALLERSIAAHGSALEMLPDYPEFRAMLGQALHNQLQLWVQRGELDGLLEVSEAVSDHLPDGPQSFYDLAVCLTTGATQLSSEEADEAALRHARDLRERAKLYLSRAIDLAPELEGRADGDPRLATLQVP